MFDNAWRQSAPACSSDSPDLNPIEQAGSKLKTLLRSQKAQTPEALYNAIKPRLPAITAQDA